MNKEKYLFPNEIVYKSDSFSIAQDWEVPIPGFFIISSSRNIRSIEEFLDEESIEFIFLLKKLRIGMNKVLKIKDIYVFQNEDTKHGFHFWVFPRHNWMEKFGRKIESVRPIMNYSVENMQTKNVFKEIKEAVQKMKVFMNE